MHDAAVAGRLHHPPGRSGDVHGAEDVGLDHVTTEAVGVVLDRRLAHDTGVVDHDVEPAERVDRGGDHVSAPSGSAMERGVEDGLAARGDDLVDHGLRRVLGRDLGDAVGVGDADAEIVHDDLARLVDASSRA